MGQHESLFFQNEYFEVISKIFKNFESSNTFIASWVIGQKLSQILRKILIYTSKIRGDAFGTLLRKVQAEVHNRRLIPVNFKF